MASSVLWLLEARVPRQIAGDVLLVRLDRAAADLQQLGVAPPPLHLILADGAVAAEHLDRAVGDVLGYRRAEQLDAVGIDAVAAALEAQVSGGLVDVRAARHPRGVRVAMCC